MALPVDCSFSLSFSGDLSGGGSASTAGSMPGRLRPGNLHDGCVFFSGCPCFVVLRGSKGEKLFFWRGPPPKKKKTPPCKLLQMKAQREVEKQPFQCLHANLACNADHTRAREPKGEPSPHLPPPVDFFCLGTSARTAAVGPRSAAVARPAAHQWKRTWSPCPRSSPQMPPVRNWRFLACAAAHMAMGHDLWLHFGPDEHPLATYFDVHQGYSVLTHSHIAGTNFPPSPLNEVCVKNFMPPRAGGKNLAWRLASWLLATLVGATPR